MRVIRWRPRRRSPSRSLAADRRRLRVALKAEAGDTAAIADRYPDFELLLEQFQGTLDALFELLQTVSPHVQDLDAQGYEVPLQLPGPEAESRFAEALAGSVKDEEEPEAEKPSDGEPRDENGNDDSTSLAPPDSSSEDHPAARSRPADAHKLVENLVAAFGDEPETLEKILRVFRTITTRPHRGALLHASLLAMAVGAVETAIAGIATQHFVLHPHALPADEKEFSLADLSEFEDVADARDLAINRRIDGLMRGGLNDWSKWFKPLLGFTFDELAGDWPKLVENFQRRHIVIHNAGRVSRQYQAKVQGDDLPALGAELPISREYLEDALDEMRIFGTRLLLLAWSKWVPDKTGEASVKANEIVFEQLNANRLRSAQCLASTGKGLATEDLTRYYLQINEWQAAKRRDGLEAVIGDIEAWDTSALNPALSVAKAALLDDFDQVFSLLPEVIERRDLPAEALEWPLFKEAREDPRWAALEASVVEEASAPDDQAEAVPPLAETSEAEQNSGTPTSREDVN